MDTTTTPLSPEDSSLLSSFLNLASQILSWDFSEFEPKQQSESELRSWTPPQPYLQAYFDPSFLDLFFKLLGRVLGSEDQLHHVMQCLIHLALLVSDDPTDHRRYLTNFVSGILGHVSARRFAVPLKVVILFSILDVIYSITCSVSEPDPCKIEKERLVNGMK